jgi:hypothetical protein
VASDSPDSPDASDSPGGAAKITRKLASRLARGADRPVRGAVFAALDTDKLPLTSFASRAAARNQEVQAKLARILTAIERWETEQGQPVPLEVHPDSASIVVTGPAALYSALAADPAVAALDLDLDLEDGAAPGRAAGRRPAR